MVISNSNIRAMQKRFDKSKGRAKKRSSSSRSRRIRKRPNTRNDPARSIIDISRSPTVSKLRKPTTSRGVRGSGFSVPGLIGSILTGGVSASIPFPFFKKKIRSGSRPATIFETPGPGESFKSNFTQLIENYQRDKTLRTQIASTETIAQERIKEFTDVQTFDITEFFNPAEIAARQQREAQQRLIADLENQRMTAEGLLNQKLLLDQFRQQAAASGVDPAEIQKLLDSSEQLQPAAKTSLLKNPFVIGAAALIVGAFIFSKKRK